jgi:mono/diheme cytochrome c family protein
VTGTRTILVSLVVAVTVASCIGESDRPDPQVVARGAELYQQSCVQCHGGPNGGEISDIPPVHNANGHTWHHSDCLLHEIIRDGLPPRADPDHPVMPGYGDEFTEEEIDAVLAHIRTWWTPEQQAQQAAVTAETCPST